MRWSSVVGVGVVVLATACQAQAPVESISHRHAATETEPGSHGDSGSTPSDEAAPEAGAPARRLEGSDEWRMTQMAKDGQIEAYTTRVSAPPGAAAGAQGVDVGASVPDERVPDRCLRRRDRPRSCTGPGWSQASGRPTRCSSRLETRTVVAPWHVSLTARHDRLGAGLLRAQAADRRRAGSTWSRTSCPRRPRPGTVALVAPVTTWQAYNQLGRLQPLRRPERRPAQLGGQLRPALQRRGRRQRLPHAAIPIVVRAERLGIPLSYFTNVDLHDRPDAARRGPRLRLDGPRRVLDARHARPRSRPARDAGTNLAFLGANTMYWRIRLERPSDRAARLMTGYRDDAALDPLRDERPAEATSRFRDAPGAEPENATDRDALRVLPGRRRLRRRLAEAGGASPGPARRTETGSRGWSVREADRVYPDAGAPRPMQVLSHSSYSCRGVTTTSQSVYYTAASGAGVFTAGTLRWGCALVDRCDRPLGPRTRDFVRQVTDNLFHGFAAGPVGRVTRPATTSRTSTCPSSTRSRRADPVRLHRIQPSWLPCAPSRPTPQPAHLAAGVRAAAHGVHRRLR